MTGRSYGTVRIDCTAGDRDEGSGKGKKAPIKIDPNEYRHRSSKMERAFTKQDLKVDKSKLFMDPIIELDDEQNGRYESLLNFCIKMNRCVYGCRGCIDLTNFSATPDGTGIRAQCSECLNYTADESGEARGHVKWLNSLLADYGKDFGDGLPPLVKHEKKGRWCGNCKQVHTRMEWYDYRKETND